MANAADYIKTQPEVVDLLITMAKAACRSHRRELIFNPFPTIFDPKNPMELALNPKVPDYDKVLKIFENFPELEDLLQFDGVGLKKELDDRAPLIYLLLKWIIANNRSHITKLQPEKQLDFMKTKHQYIMRTSAPAKEAAFAEARRKFGSTFAFHGSSMENWHSILSVGLMNASGTKHQVNGAMYGDGIYLSPSASTSFNYCGRSSNRDGPTQSCIALCEVIKSEDMVKDPCIWVVPNPDHVVTRFFFVCTTSLTDQSINTESAHIREKISLAYCHPGLNDPLETTEQSKMPSENAANI
jgi:poly [ADP-ribose] polymerase 6/8